MPGMYDMMYGNLSSPDAQQGYNRGFNNPMIQYGMQMLQGQNPFGAASRMLQEQNPFGAASRMLTLPYSPGGPTQQMQTLPYAEPNARGGRRRIRIGNKTYEEVDDIAQGRL
jgi:hypothetical protein